MKKFIINLFFISVYKFSVSQNLIHNGNFEQYTICPSVYGNFEGYVYDWVNPTTGSPYGTPDYFNQCANNLLVGVPGNIRGWQNPHSGSAYTGITIARVTTNTNFREYIEVPLSSTLHENTCYQFQMYISLTNESQYTSSDIGVYFSTALISGISNHNPLPFTPQIINSSTNYPDTLNWTLISGYYLADGTENYLTIGNFKDSSTTTTYLINNTSTSNLAFIYIDDVSLTPCETTNLTEIDGELISIFPNPFRDELKIQIHNNKVSQIVIYDLLSRKIMEKQFINTISLNSLELDKGVYIYEIRVKDAILKQGKIVKE